MIRCAALVAMCVALVAPLALAQVTYTSQNRRIAASASGEVARSAPNFEPWSDTVSRSTTNASAEASQTSQLGSFAASLSHSARASTSPFFGSSSASSTCTFTFTPLDTTTAKIVGTGAPGSSFSLNGPGVRLAESAGAGGSSWDIAVVLEAGQSYTFASSLSGFNNYFSSLNLTLTFVVQSRAFSYQGVVRDASGQPISTPTDLEFRLFNHPNLGDGQVGSTITANAVPVANGLFTQNLDFGDVFNGEARWLEVSVRNPAGSGAFTPVLPRTPILGVPQSSYAIRAAIAILAESATHAENAAAAASVPWSGITDVPSNVSDAYSPWHVAGGGISFADSVGIGSPAPLAKLEVNAVGQDGLYVHTNNSSPWAIRIGNDAVSDQNFKTGMYVADTGLFRVTTRAGLPNGTYTQLGTNGAWTAPSDARLKTDVTPADGLLSAALRLRPVNFKWIADGPRGKADFGLIAQEVKDVLPVLVTGDEHADMLTLNYSQLSVVAIGAIQEQQAQIKALRDQNDAKQREIDDLKARLERLERAAERSK